MTHTTVAAPESVVSSFFDAYRDRDLTAMTDLCTRNAGFHYLPVEIWGKQRVIRGDGKVHGVGKALWAGLITAFPDLSNQVLSLSSSPDGTVLAEVVLSGTQASAWGPFTNRGQSFSLPHLFVLHVDGGLIDSITAYWDNASFSRQLGHLEVD
ncbi:MAG TPA: ester cyclase [Streptosporangiaceae bacterium]|jgi:ketosteroid isomerase-like protein